MKKIFLSVLVLFLVGLFTASAASNLTITTGSISLVPGNPGTTVSGEFIIVSTTAIATVNYQVPSLVNVPGGTITTPVSGSISSLVANDPRTVPISITIPYKLAGVYTGTLTATDAGNSENTDSISFSLTIASLYALDVQTYTTSSPLVITADKGDIKSKTFTIKNIGSQNLALSSSSFTHNIDLIDTSNNEIILTFSSDKSSLAPGETATITVTADVDQDQILDTYSGTVTVTSGSATDTFNLEIRVRPEICEDGPIGNLVIDLDEPEAGDDFSPGDVISISLDVDNDADEDLDVIVEAILYNIDEDDEVESVESESTTIDEDDTESFDLDLTVPEEDLNSADDYVLFIKAYEEDNEDEQCEEESVSLDLKLNKHDVRIKNVQFTPSSVSCGDLVSVATNIINLGTSNEDDVYVQIKQSDLGIDVKSTTYSLDKISKSDNDAIASLDFTVPVDAESKTYNFEVNVLFGGKRNTEFETLTVSCEEKPKVVTMNILKTDLSVTQGSAFTLPVLIKNSGSSQITLTVEAIGVGNWASSDSKTVTLDKNEETTINLQLTANSDATTGSHTIVTTVSSGTKQISSQSTTANVKEKSPAVTGKTITGFTWKNNTPTIFWIIGDIVLVIVAIYFVKMIFTRKRS